MNIRTSQCMEDIEDLMLTDNFDAHRNKKCVLPRAIRHKTVREQQTCADSIIPGSHIVICCN